VARYVAAAIHLKSKGVVMNGINGIRASSASQLASGAQQNPAASQGTGWQPIVRTGGGEFKPVDGLKEPGLNKDSIKDLTEVFKGLNDVFKGLTDVFKGLTDLFKSVTDAGVSVLKSGSGLVKSVASQVSSLVKSAT
jgi:hypothetical protein